MTRLSMDPLSQADPQVADAIRRERLRQEEGLELIASENAVSRAVLQAMGTVLTNKYAEGLPGRRYYGGCAVVDEVEVLARSRARALFGSDGANVQPHSGAQANAAAYLALLQPGETVLGLDLSHGGHLTHGSPVNFSGKLYRAVHYGVDPATGRIDLDQVREVALRHRPRLIVTGASAYPRTWDFEGFRSIADEVGAALMCDMAHFAGLVATGHHPSPVPWCEVVTTTTHKTLRGPRGGLILGRRSVMKRLNSAVFPGTQGGPLMHVIAAKAVALHEAAQPAFATYIGQVVENAAAMAERLLERGFRLVSGGTDNHLLLLDFTGTELTGLAAEQALERAGITANKNTVPGEQRSPMVTSGLRLGSPVITTRGAGREDARRIADWVADVLEAPTSEEVARRVRAEVRAWCAEHPLYTDAVDPS